MKWLRRTGYAVATVLIGLGFSILGRSKRRQKAAERREIDHLAQGSEAARERAAREMAKAKMHEDLAREAAAVGQAAIDKVGANDENMASVLDSWRSDRRV